MDRPGAFQAGCLRKLMESRPLPGRVPDKAIIAEGQGEKGERMEAFRGADSDYAMIYMPVGKRISVNTGFMKCKRVTAWWFNPRDATVRKIATANRTPRMEFTAPAGNRENDWVLVIDDEEKNFREPGQ